MSWRRQICRSRNKKKKLSKNCSLSVRGTLEHLFQNYCHSLDAHWMLNLLTNAWAMTSSDKYMVTILVYFTILFNSKHFSYYKYQSIGLSQKCVEPIFIEENILLKVKHWFHYSLALQKIKNIKDSKVKHQIVITFTN